MILSGLWYTMVKRSIIIIKWWWMERPIKFCNTQNSHNTASPILYRLYSIDQAATDGVSSICPPVHLRPHFYILMVRRLNPSLRWTASLRPPSTSVHLGQIIMVCRHNSFMRLRICLRPAVHVRPPMENNHGLSSFSVNEVDGSWSKNSSARPPSNDNLGPASEFVHEMDGLSQNSGPLSTSNGLGPLEAW